MNNMFKDIIEEILDEVNLAMGDISELRPACEVFLDKLSSCGLEIVYKGGFNFKNLPVVSKMDKDYNA